jgi:hypothetical protein
MRTRPTSSDNIEQIYGLNLDTRTGLEFRLSEPSVETDMLKSSKRTYQSLTAILFVLILVFLGTTLSNPSRCLGRHSPSCGALRLRLRHTDGVNLLEEIRLVDEAGDKGTNRVSGTGSYRRPNRD